MNNKCCNKYIMGDRLVIQKEVAPVYTSQLIDDVGYLKEMTFIGEETVKDTAIYSVAFRDILVQKLKIKIDIPSDNVLSTHANKRPSIILLVTNPENPSTTVSVNASSLSGLVVGSSTTYLSEVDIVNDVAILQNRSITRASTLAIAGIVTDAVETQLRYIAQPTIVGVNIYLRDTATNTGLPVGTTVTIYGE